MSKHSCGDEIVQLVKRGDIQALDVITRCFGDRLLAIGRRTCRDEEEAQDAVQDALLSAGIHLTSFRGEGSVEGWLGRMVQNACFRMRRGRKNDPSLHRTDLEVQAHEEDPEQLSARAETATALGHALLTLPPMDRAILLLAEGEGWTGPEIAERMGLSPGAVRTRLTRMRSRLREELRALHRPSGSVLESLATR
ncbi:MAG: sigma-70 family RNA polymerase sigma factor [Deltaproteobacteria bacterium]|nr:sigma-70 family RNA polymerase sigma factor [Deltaproteobacteria bacterium]